MTGHLAVQLLNEALAGNLVQTTHSGANPVWNQPLTNRIALDNVPYIQSFAFVRGGQRSLVVFNLHRDSPLEVTFTGNAPSGNVALRRLTATAITDHNENAENVQITRQQLTNFDPAQPLSLPPFSLNVLSWNTAARGDVNADGIVNLVDVIYLIYSFFAGGPAPLGLADVNADGAVDIRDLFALINHLFSGATIPA